LTSRVNNVSSQEPVFQVCGHKIGLRKIYKDELTFNLKPSCSSDLTEYTVICVSVFVIMSETLLETG
jgi:hypothetical protein